MFGFLRKLFGKRSDGVSFTEEECRQHVEAKQAALERILGKTHETFEHSLIPFHAGGMVSMFYFPHAMKGTGFATMELIAPDGSGPRPGVMGTYELVAFTRHKIDMEEDGPFNEIRNHLCGLFTLMAYYASMAVLNPGETCTIPADEDGDVRCLVFDEYRKDGVSFEFGGRKYGLLMCVEVFPEEVEFAQENGTGQLIERLKEKGYYPYSDLDREPVV